MKRVLFGAAILVLGVGCAGSSRTQGPDHPVREPPEEEETSESPSGSDRPGVEPPASERERESPRESGERARTFDEVFPEERVTLDYRETSVRRVLRLFEAKADRQLVVAQEVEGRVTLELERAPVADAFRAVLEAANLVCERRGDTLVVRPRRDGESR